MEPGHFLPVNGQSCFTAAEFSQARVQLANAGLREDGYEALKFALDNVPFRRNNPFVAKNMILITDEGRNVIPQGENITRQSIEADLRRNGVLLNVVVQANYQVDFFSPPSSFSFSISASPSFNCSPFSSLF